MQQSKRRATTVQLKPRIAKAMRVRAARNDKTIAEVVNTALAEDLRRDAESIRIARERENEPVRPLHDVLADMKKNGLL